MSFLHFGVNFGVNWGLAICQLGSLTILLSNTALPGQRPCLLHPVSHLPIPQPKPSPVAAPYGLLCYDAAGD